MLSLRLDLGLGFIKVGFEFGGFLAFPHTVNIISCVSVEIKKIHENK